MDESKLDSLITQKTKAIVPVHYAGVGCEMDSIMHIANDKELLVVEDAAQAVNAYYKGRALGALATSVAIAFTKPKTTSQEKVERCSLMINALRSVRKSFGRKVQIVASSFEAKSTNILGSTLVQVSCHLN